MNTPTLLALLALVFSGMSRFTWKIAGANRVYSPSYMLVFCVAFGIVAVAIHLVQRHPLDLPPRMMGLAALAGALGAVATYSLLLALRLGGEGSIVFPIAGLAMVVPVTLSFLIYHEPITASKLFGFGFAAISIIFLSR